METIELKQLLSFAPYKVKGKYLDSGILWECDPLADEVDYDNYKLPLFHFLGREKPCKLVLYPLSCLTKPIEHNGEKFVPIGKLSIHLFPLLIKNDILTGEIDGIPYWVMGKLFEWHFDCFNLIEKGLAINKATLKDNDR